MPKFLIPSTPSSEKNIPKQRTPWNDFHHRYHSDEFRYSVRNDEFMRLKRNYVRDSSQKSMTQRFSLRRLFTKRSASGALMASPSTAAVKSSSSSLLHHKSNSPNNEKKFYKYKKQKPSKPTKGDVRTMYMDDCRFEHGEAWTWDVDIGFDPTARCLREGEEKAPFGWPTFAIVKV